tara:strand:+ start:227 stop:682 length:456 start_codon:yes stop_codon:yes gene_type:complete
MDDALRMAMRDSMQQGQLDEEEKKAKALEAVKRSKSQNRPSILDIAPAVQDKTRVGGLMEDIEVPDGEFADLDMMKEDLVNKGFPAGLVNDIIEKLKNKDPQVMAMHKKMQEWYKNNPEKEKEVATRLGKNVDEEDLPEDPGEGMGDMGAF